MLRRGCRRLMVKLFFVAAIIWITSLVIVGRTPRIEDVVGAARAAVPNAGGNDGAKQPVLERPDFDRMRFQEAMRQSAEKERRRKESRDQAKLIQEELARRRAEDRRVPPFMIAPFVNGSATKKQSNLLGFLFRGAAGKEDVGMKQDGKQMDPKIASLIASGLIVPKWNIESESPADPGAPGKLFGTQSFD